LTAPLHGKVKVHMYQQIIYTSKQKLQFEAAISGKHVLPVITYKFVDNLPLTKTMKRCFYFPNFFMIQLLIITPSSRTTIQGQPLGLPQKYGFLGKTILIEHHLGFCLSF